MNESVRLFAAKVTEVGKAISAVAIIVSFLGAAWAATFGPISKWIKQLDDMIAWQSEITEATASNTNVLSGLVEQVENLKRDDREARTPALEFEERGNRITDGQLGGVVKMRWVFRKLRDCGAPRIDVFFINGGGRIHRFRDISVLDQNRRGIAAPVDTRRVQSIEYTARIPGGDGVQPTGNETAYGFVTVSYPENCPKAPEVRSPDVPFRIYPERTGND